MSHVKFTTSMGAAILVAALAACSSDTTSPNGAPVSDQQVSNDVANVSAPDAAADAGDFAVEGNSGANFGMIAGTPGKMSASTTTCGPSTTIMVTYVFGRANQDTVNFNRTREWFADGACATVWSPAVDSVEFVGTWSEVLSDVSGNWSRHADRVRHSTVMGTPTLDSATAHVWNANALVHDTSNFVGPAKTRNYEGTAYDTAIAVTFNHPRDGEIYPVSGTWTRWLTANLTVTGAVTKNETIERHVLVTFNGTEFVPLTIYNVQNGQVALTCQVDLLTHRIVPGSCNWNAPG